MGMKLESVKNFITNYKFDNPNWKTSEIKEGLKRLLGEEVGIKVNYIKDVKINEILSTSEEVTIIESIDISFTDDDDKIKTMEYKPNDIY